MPVIVYKQMEVHVVWVQLRRILCDGCRLPFTYLAEGTAKAVTVGVPVLSADESMRQTIEADLKESLAQLAFRPRQGQALCPHCSRYQVWMVDRSRRERAKAGLVVGVGIGVLAALGWTASSARWTTDPTHYLVLMSLGALLGSGAGAMLAISRGPHPRRVDVRSTKDETLQGHLTRCQEVGKDPALVWYLQTGGRLGPGMTVVALPPHDATQRAQR